MDPIGTLDKPVFRNLHSAEKPSIATRTRAVKIALEKRNRCHSFFILGTWFTHSKNYFNFSLTESFKHLAPSCVWSVSGWEGGGIYVCHGG